MPNPKLMLIAGRSLKQGTGMNIGKESAEYRQAVSTMEMNREDMARLGLVEGDALKVKASGGEAVVYCKGGDLPAGMAFIAYGPMSSQLMEQETHGSGMPNSKGFEVEVERVG
jgi:formylmethanofuran dehydrogenase subunit D